MNNLQGLIKAIQGLIATAFPIMVGVALLTFFWGMVRSISTYGDKAGVEKGRNIMLWGVLALFVMVSVWGLVHFIQGALGLTNFTL